MMFLMKKSLRLLKTSLAIGISALGLLSLSSQAFAHETISAEAADDIIIYRLNNLGTRGPDMDEALICGVLRDIGRLEPGTHQAVQCRTLPRDNAFGSGYFNLRDIRKFAKDNFHSEAKSTAWLESVETKIRDNANSEHPEYAEQQLKICEAANDVKCAGKYRIFAILGFKARAESGDPKAMVQLVDLVPKSYFNTPEFLRPATENFSEICVGLPGEDCQEKFERALKAKMLDHKNPAQAHDDALKTQLNSGHPEGWKIVQDLRLNQKRWKQKAIDTYTEAAKLGDQAAMFSLGYMIDTQYDRRGSRQDQYAAVANWYEKFFATPSDLRSKILHRHSEEGYIFLFNLTNDCRDQIAKDRYKNNMWGQYQSEFETEHCDVNVKGVDGR